MVSGRILLLTGLAMLAFAGNSVLCRLALKETGIDAASFTGIRLIAGGGMLYLLVAMRKGRYDGRGNWLSAFALLAYAACFSFAYISLPAASGALILFVSVQATMIGYGIAHGERLRPAQSIGLILALGGLIGLLLPGLSAPPLFGSLLMIISGAAWGVYSLRGKRAGDPLRVTTGNFLRAIPFAAALTLLTIGEATVDPAGFWYAVVSGALTSGIGYALWYTVVPALRASTAATVQLSVPVITALGGAIFLGEAITLRLVLASLAILGGIALVIARRH